MGKLKKYISLIFKSHPDTSTPEGRELMREKSIALTAIAALLAKFVSMAVPLVTVRLTLAYMGEEIYGLWSAVSSFFTLFTFADLGLGSGLQTALSRATAMDDKKYCRRLVSTTYSILVVVSFILTVSFLVAFPFVNWADVIKAESNRAIALVGKVVIAIVLPQLVNIPMALIQRTQNAMQEGYRQHLWHIAASLLSLVSVVVVYCLDLGVVIMVWVYSLVTVVVSLLNMLVYFGFQHPELSPSFKLYDKNLQKNLLSTGIWFFILSVFTSLSLSVDNFIVGRTCSLASVATYSVMYKVVNLLSAIRFMFSTPLWAANGEAMQRGEYAWVRKNTSKIARFSILIGSFFTIFIILLIKPALFILSDGMIATNYALLLPMCLLQILMAFTSPYFMILNAAGIVKFQIAIYFVYALVGLPLKFVFGDLYGMTAITWVGVISYLFLLTIPTCIRGKRYLNEKARTEANV